MKNSIHEFSIFLYGRMLVWGSAWRPSAKNATIAGQLGFAFEENFFLFYFLLFFTNAILFTGRTLILLTMPILHSLLHLHCTSHTDTTVLDGLSNFGKLFGIWNREEDFLLLNHLLIIAKNHIYECRKNRTRPLECFALKILTYVYQLERQVMKSNNKEFSHNLKWRKYIDNLE